MVERRSPKPKVAGSNPVIPVFGKLNMKLISKLNKIKNEFKKIQYSSFKENCVFTVFVVIILMVFSGLVVFFDFCSIQIVKSIF